MISTRSKWRARARAAARAASSCLPWADFVTCPGLDWSEGTWGMLCAKARPKSGLKRMLRKKAAIPGFREKNIRATQKRLISLFVPQRSYLPSNRIEDRLARNGLAGQDSHHTHRARRLSLQE